MALHKIGSLVKIAAAGVTLEDVVVERPPEQKIIEPRNAEFLYFRARAISAGDQGPKKGSPNPNGNGDYFPRRELEASYETFRGRNLFLNHESDHPVKSIGKILDAYPVEDPETSEYYIECLAKIDRKLHPEIARMVETGELNTVSMGCSCEASMCSVCGITIHSDEDDKCDHLSPSGILKQHVAEIDMPEYGVQKGQPTLAYSINSGLSFNELSIVNVPADASATIKSIIASNLKSKISKKATLDDTEQEHLKTLLASLDEKAKQDFCACVLPKEEKPMSDKVVEKKESEGSDVNDVLSKINALEYIKLANWMEHKLSKASEKPVEKVSEKVEPVKVEEPKKDNTIVERALNAVKSSPLGKLFSNAVKREIETQAKAEEKPSIRAEFTANDDIKQSHWSLFRGDRRILRATLGQLWDETDLNDKDHCAWATSEEYGHKLADTYQEFGFSKTAELLGLGYKKTEVSTEEKVSKPEGSFVKPGAETKADKEADKSQDALHKADETAVGEHLESSKPESDQKKEASEKKADESVIEDAAPPVDAPVVEDKPIDAPMVEDADPADAPELHESAFDKLDAGLTLSEGIVAKKDKETGDVVVTDASGMEVKRMPDGFGTDVPSVIKLLQSVLGLAPEHEDAPAGQPVPEEPKVEAPVVEEAPVPEAHPEEVMSASKKDSITKKAEELAAKEKEIQTKEAELNAKRFGSALAARTEHCKKVVAAMLQKDMLGIEQSDVDASLKQGKTLLAAREAALKSAVNRQVKTLLAMDEVALKAFEDSVNNVKIKKEASKSLTTPLHLSYRIPTEQDEISDIFDSMGNGGGVR
jgi:hypothetical protein